MEQFTIEVELGGKNNMVYSYSESFRHVDCSSRTREYSSLDFLRCSLIVSDNPS